MSFLRNLEIGNLKFRNLRFQKFQTIYLISFIHNLKFKHAISSTNYCSNFNKLCVVFLYVDFSLAALAVGKRDLDLIIFQFQYNL